MKYTILYDKAAVKFIKKQSPAQQRRILEAVHALPDEFATYFPTSSTIIKKSSKPKEPTKRELAVDAIKAFLEYLEQEV